MICAECGRDVESGHFHCPFCGHELGQPTESMKEVQYPKSEILVGSEAASSKRTEPIQIKKKTPLIAITLALIPGVFGIFGLGHIYAGKIRRGIILLIVGIVVVPICIFGIFLLGFLGSLVFGGSAGWGFVALLIILNVIYVGLFLWQIYDANSCTKEYNRIHRI